MTTIEISKDGWVTIHHEPAREYRVEDVFMETFGEIGVDVEIHDLRECPPITPKFKVEPKPATRGQYYQLLKNFFTPKGIKLNEDFTIEV